MTERSRQKARFSIAAQPGGAAVRSMGQPHALKAVSRFKMLLTMIRS
jgi:hypothetical protein